VNEATALLFHAAYYLVILVISMERTAARRCAHARSIAMGAVKRKRTRGAIRTRQPPFCAYAEQGGRKPPATCLYTCAPLQERKKARALREGREEDTAFARMHKRRAS